MTNDIPIDSSQIAFMAEEMILVDEQDVPCGTATKKEAHLLESLKLHRAFSLFLFNSNKRLLIQKRASCKATFAGLWANTCCSHPLYVEKEMNGTEGVKNAIQRKLQHELGILSGTIPHASLHPLTRILYKASSDQNWGEYELDHCIAGFAPDDIDIYLNPKEVEEIRWVTKEELRDEMEREDPRGSVFAPWFRHVCELLLFKVWDSIDDGNVPSFDSQIHHVGDF
ncbi:hypothetical protein P9112_009158 [Eukaryota sp. TZLM1-RC]